MEIWEQVKKLANELKRFSEWVTLSICAASSRLYFLLQRYIAFWASVSFLFSYKLQCFQAKNESDQQNRLKAC